MALWLSVRRENDREQQPNRTEQAGLGKLESYQATHKLPEPNIEREKTLRLVLSWQLWQLARPRLLSWLMSFPLPGCCRCIFHITAYLSPPTAVFIMRRQLLSAARSSGTAGYCLRCGRPSLALHAVRFFSSSPSETESPSTSQPFQPPYRLLLLDTAGIMYRAHYGYSSSPLIRPSDSRHVSALYSLCNLVLSLLTSYRPTHILAALDMPSAPSGGVPSYRRTLLPSYKANRAPTPTDLSWQLAQAQRVLEAMGVVTRGEGGYEADDVIASAVTRAYQDAGEGEVGIVSQDKDFVQLLAPNIALLRFTSTTNTPASSTTTATASSAPPAATLQSSAFPTVPLYDSSDNQSASPYSSSSFTSYSSTFSLSPFTADHCHLRYGIPPSSFVDYLALVGDASDNIPGVSAIGAKTATSLLQRYHTLDAVLEAAKRGDITGSGKREQRIHRALIDEEQDVLQWRELVRMKADLPVPGLDEMAVEGWESEERVEQVVRLLEEMEFPTLVPRMRRIAEDERRRKRLQAEQSGDGVSIRWPELREREEHTVSVSEARVESVLRETEEVLAPMPRKRIKSLQKANSKVT